MSKYIYILSCLQAFLFKDFILLLSCSMDTVVAQLIAGEYNRQKHELELIASENYVSKEVMDAYANVFTNKYSEGYPGKRYYGWQEWVDKLELLCQWRALKMFDLIEEDEPDALAENGRELLKASLKTSKWSCNVQPLSGSPANTAVYLRCIKPGDTILGMDLWAGWHLTHGHPLNVSWVFYNIVPYGVDEKTHCIDYDALEAKALEHKPALILAWFSAYPRTLDREAFARIANKVKEVHGYKPLVMADVCHISWLIAWWVVSSPFPYVDIVTTTTHKSLRGPRGALIFMKKGKLKRNGEEISLTKMVNRWVFPGTQWGPHEHIIAAKAVAFEEIISGQTNIPRTPKWFDVYAKTVVNNAKILADELMAKWRNLVSWWTDNHIVLVDVTTRSWKDTGIGGKVAEHILEEVGLSCNKNMIPFDQRSPMDPSGIRLWTPAITTRGLWVEEMKIIADVIDQALLAHDDADILCALKSRIQSLCELFPLWYD